MKTRGEEMLALRKARMAASPPILRGGFRPFFLFGAAWGVVALGLWLGALLAGLALPTAFDPLAWHRHEMLFGFVGAMVAGFLLTAIPNWTGRLPIAGPPLAAIAGLWLAGRLAVLWSGSLGWILAPTASATGLALAGVGILQLVRLVRWTGWRTVSDPLVLILHIGYLWVPIGLLLLGWSVFAAGVPRSAAIHALTAGAMATMILAVTTRATLGHTGRELRASPATVAAYLAVTVGALLRLAASLGLIDYRLGLALSGALWAGGFVLFLLAYGPILFGPRLDAKPG